MNDVTNEQYIPNRNRDEPQKEVETPPGDASPPTDAAPPETSSPPVDDESPSVEAAQPVDAAPIEARPGDIEHRGRLVRALYENVEFDSDYRASDLRSVCRDYLFSVGY